MRKRLVILVIMAMMAGTAYAQKNIKSMQGNSGKRWAICIGINDYKDKRIVDLKNARNDAKTLGRVLKASGQFDDVVVMTDDLDSAGDNYPKKSAIQAKLGAMKSQVKPDDLVLFFFSGHGISAASGDGFLVLANSYRENLNGTSLRVKDVVKWLAEVGVKKSILLVDGSREKFLHTGSSKGIAMENFVENAVGAAFYGTKAGGVGYDDTGAAFGAFAGFVIDGIGGHADGNKDGIVSFSELSGYLGKGIPQWASSAGKRQEPETRIFTGAYADLVLSSYGTAPARRFKPAAVAAVTAVTLRTAYLTLKGNDTQAMLKKRGFFDKKWNPNRTFANHYEAKNIAGDAVVTDRATGLTWHAAGSEKGIEFTEARNWINALNEKGYAGFKDWRMPTLEEAVSLLESSKKNGNLYVDPVFNAAQVNTWTGDLSSSESAWIVFFDQGRVNRDYFFNFFFVRPVRSAK